MAIFRRRKSNSEPEREDVFDKLRGQVIHLDPAAAGMARTPGSSLVWGGMMEMGYPRATASLVCLRDGTTSMYTSTGGGIIGGGGHAAVVSVNHAFLAALAAHADRLRADERTPLPGVGRVVLRALTYDGPMMFEASDEELRTGRSVLSPVYGAAQDVLTQLRLLDERLSAGN